MRSLPVSRRGALSVLLALSLAATPGLVVSLSALPGCSPSSALWMQDYQRDLLFGVGALAISLLTNGATQQPADGISCWDLNGNGTGDPEEDVNGDGIFSALDCQGPQGPAGQPAPDNGAGQPVPGVDGINCWDLDGDRVNDPEEDVNEDGVFDALDCQGPQGDQGPSGGGGSGPAGPQGPPGSTLFDLFIDAFFGNDGTGELPVKPVEITEPYLGTGAADDGTGSIAYRVAIPELYDAGNPVTMRLYFWRTGAQDGCFAFRMDVFRLMNGTGVLEYGPGDNTRFIKVDVPANPDPAGVFLVIDLPLNIAEGLGFPNDLDKAHFLAFELSTVLNDWVVTEQGPIDDPITLTDGGAYTLLGVEFFESMSAGDTGISGASVYTDMNAALESCVPDACPDDPNKTEPGICGCGVVEDTGDDDEDGVINCFDLCPDTPVEEQVDADGCACSQLDPGDDDGDGVDNCFDECPGTPEFAEVDEVGCPIPCDAELDVDIYIMLDRTASAASILDEESALAKAVFAALAALPIPDADVPKIAVGSFGCLGISAPTGTPDACTLHLLSNSDRYGDDDFVDDGDHHGDTDIATGSTSSEDAGTHFAAALAEVGLEFARRSAFGTPRILIFVSDGLDDDDLVTETTPAAEALKASGVEIYSVLYSSDLEVAADEEAALRAIATDENHFFIEPAPGDVADAIIAGADFSACEEDGDDCTEAVCQEIVGEEGLYCFQLPIPGCGEQIEQIEAN